MSDLYPQRIVCLTEETTEMLYILGEEKRIAGISGFTVRPPQARREKPRVSAFISAKIDKILDLRPDLVLGFSDLQADIAAELIRRGLNVHVFNQRSVEDIFRMISLLGAMVGRSDKAGEWIEQQRHKIVRLKEEASRRPNKPKIYFEEWYDPIITGIQWVAELIGIAGGEDCFPELSGEKLAKNRIIKDPGRVIRRNPDIIIGSWCGRRFRPEKLARRPGWADITAVRNGHIYEIKSSDILQPGPAALTDGLDQLKEIIDKWHSENGTVIEGNGASV